MLFNPRLTTLVALLSACTTHAADICSYTNRNCLSSTFGCCTNVPAGTCCYWQYDFLGWSVQFRNITGTLNWIGNTHTDSSCGVQVGTIGFSAGVTSGCISVSTTSNVNWFSGRYVFNGTVAALGTKAGDVPKCRAPDVLGFTYSNKEYRVNVPEGQLESFVRLLQAEDYEALWAVSQEA